MSPLKRKVNILEKQFQEYQPDDSVNWDLAPPLIKRMMDEILKPACRETPELVVINVLFSQIAASFSWNKVKIVIDESTDNAFSVPLNYFGISLLGSGEGKDRALSSIKNYILKDVFKEFKFRSENHKKTLENKEENKDKTFHVLRKTVETGTVEGFYKQGESVMDYEFGALTFESSEFGYFIENPNKNNELIELLVKLYEQGNAQGKKIKGEVDSRDLEDVPCNMCAFSSPEPFKEGKGRDNLMRFLNTGIARRSFMCYPNVDELVDNSECIDDMTDEEVFIKEFDNLTNYKKPLENSKEISKKMLSIYSIISTNEISGPRIKKPPVKIRMTEKARVLHSIYELIGRYKSHLKRSISVEGQRAEIKNRYWKCLRLAGMFSIINHPTRLIIEEKDYLQAYHFTELFGQHFSRFFNEAGPPAPALRAAQWIMQQREEGNRIKISDFYRRKYQGKSGMSGKEWLDRNEDEINLYLMDCGYWLHIDRGRNSMIKAMRPGEILED